MTGYLKMIFRRRVTVLASVVPAKDFKRCCGRGSQGLAPKDVHIIPNFLEGAELQAWAELGRSSSGKRLKVVDIEASTPDKTVRMLDDRRVTERVDIGEAGAKLEALIRRAYAEFIIPEVGRRPGVVRGAPHTSLPARRFLSASR